MSDQKISGLTATTTIADTDNLYVLKDPSGTPLDRKITGANLKASVRLPNYITPASVTVDKGTLAAGSVTSVQTKDGTNLQVTELNGADPLRVRFAFSGVTAITGFVGFLRYEGSASHEVHLEIYNGSTWETFWELTSETSNRWYNHILYNSSAYVNGGAPELRFYHVSNGVNTHNLYVDYIALVGW